VAEGGTGGIAMAAVDDRHSSSTASSGGGNDVPKFLDFLKTHTEFQSCYSDSV
jgi:hypothetical protein